MASWCPDKFLTRFDPNKKICSSTTKNRLVCGKLMSQQILTRFDPNKKSAVLQQKNRLVYDNLTDLQGSSKILLRDLARYVEDPYKLFQRPFSLKHPDHDSKVNSILLCQGGTWGFYEVPLDCLLCGKSYSTLPINTLISSSIVLFHVVHRHPFFPHPSEVHVSADRSSCMGWELKDLRKVFRDL